MDYWWLIWKYSQGVVTSRVPLVVLRTARIHKERHRSVFSFTLSFRGDIGTGVCNWSASASKPALTLPSKPCSVVKVAEII